MALRIEAQGRLIEAAQISHATYKNRPAPRGGIVSFTKASRRRLIKLFARLRSGFRGRKTFVTLTFSGTPKPAEAKAALKRLLMRWSRAYPKASAVWRMEFQDRGAVHFHLICFNLPYIPQFELQQIWTDCTGEDRSIVDIRKIKTMRGVMYYCSKYVAKLPGGAAATSLDCAPYQHDQTSESVGRFWGYWQKATIPFDICLRGLILNDGLERAWRRILQTRSGGKAGEWSSSGFLLMDRATDLLADLMHRGGWYESEYQNLKQDGTMPREACLL